MKRERKLTWTRENTYKQAIPNKPGLYKFYSKQGKLLYVGHASRLRHRVQSYMQKDDFREHPTKPALRPKIAKVAFRVMPKEKAKTLEKRLKKKAPHNHL